jgi:hypothetical protein
VLERLGPQVAGEVAVDLAVVDARPTGGAPPARLTILGRDGAPIPLEAALGRLPAYAIVGRRFRRQPG